MTKPKFQVRDVVVITASGVQGTVIEVDAERDIYTVECPGFTSAYTRVMLKLAPSQWPDEPTMTEKFRFHYPGGTADHPDA